MSHWYDVAATFGMVLTLFTLFGMNILIFSQIVAAVRRVMVG